MLTNNKKYSFELSCPGDRSTEKVSTTQIFAKNALDIMSQIVSGVFLIEQKETMRVNNKSSSSQIRFVAPTFLSQKSRWLNIPESSDLKIQQPRIKQPYILYNLCDHSVKHLRNTLFRMVGQAFWLSLKSADKGIVFLFNNNTLTVSSCL